MKGNWKWITNVRITAFDLDGNVKDVTEFHNLITTVGLGMVIDFLRGALGDGEIKDMAVGNVSTAPALADTTLGNETDRWTMTSQAEASVTSLLSIVYIPPTDAVYQIEEIGWFAGAGADGVGPDTGIMVSRVLYSRNKTSLESLQIERLDTLVEA